MRESHIQDVRMRGFKSRADVQDVNEFLQKTTLCLPSEEVLLRDAYGRVLDQDVVAEVNVPGFRRSAMDGYAVRGEDTFGASQYDPVGLRVVGESFPGRPFQGVSLKENEAVKIMTGAPLPEGCNAVVPAEVCELDNGAVRVSDSVPPLKNLGEIGEDVSIGDLVLKAGRKLRAQDVGVLASVGATLVRCVSRPRVQLVITGDELLPAGAQPRDSFIVDSNSIVLSSLVERDGGQVQPFEILPDRAEVIRTELESGDADVVLVSGGSSVGQEDHAPLLVAELGRLDYHGIAMRPSSPTGIGRLSRGGRETWVFLLPGNPVSCLSAYEFFAGPTIRALGGRNRAWPHRRLTAPLRKKISSQVGRVDYVRVALEDGLVVPIATSGASILSSTVRAAGCVLVPRDDEGMAEGEKVTVILYDDELVDQNQ